MRLLENPTTGYAWTLRARASSRTRVGLKRWRHWEGDKLVVERFAITLQVKLA